MASEERRREIWNRDWNSNIFAKGSIWPHFRKPFEIRCAEKQTSAWYGTGANPGTENNGYNAFLYAICVNNKKI